jgi:RNA-directed DNA polymerase
LEEKRVESIRDSINTNTILKRIAWLSAQAPEMVFDQLMHLVNEGSLAACFHELDGKKAVGIDEIGKAR